MDRPAQPLSFFHGLGTVSRAMTVLGQVPHVLKLLLIPLFLTLVFDGLALYFGYTWLHRQILNLVPNEGLLATLLGILGGLLVLLVLAWTFGFVYLTLCELVIDRVSEEVEAHLTGHPGSVEGMGHTLRGLLVSLLQSSVLAGLGLLGALLNVIPILGSVASLLLAAALLGYGFFVVSAGRKGLDLRQRIALARANLSPILALGGCALLTNLIPIVNLLALPVFVVAGTLLFLDVTGSNSATKPALPAPAADGAAPPR